MKLRTRLFLYVGVVFFLAFTVSLLLETYSTDKNLHQARKELRTQILSAKEVVREHVEEYLHIALSEDQARINSLLLRVARDPTLGYSLFLEGKETDLSAPTHTAFLFKNDRWIDFIQTTEKGELTALFTPIAFPMDGAHEVPINNRLSWVILKEDQNRENPLIGIKFVEDPDEERSLSFLVDELIEIDWDLTILFDPKAIIDFVPKPVPSEEEEEIEDGVDLGSVVKNVAFASKYLKEAKERATTNDWVLEDFRSKAREEHFRGTAPDAGIRCMEQEGETLNNRIIQLLQRSDQAIMISALASLFPEEAFGDSLFDPMAPLGIARFPGKSFAGQVVLTDRIFHKHKLFNDDKYFKENPSSPNCKGMGDSIAVISAPSIDQVFVGNTLALENPNNDQVEGFLTVGIDVDSLIEDLSLTRNQIAFLVHDDTVIAAFNKEAIQIKDPENVVPFEKKMLNEKSGVMVWGENRYYFIRMQPFEHLDLHFFLLQPEKEAFALADSVEEGSREVIDTVSFNMRIISLIALVFVLISLHYVAKKITRPISSLAKVTEDVASGRLEGIELPKAPKGHHDEISTLCNSFGEMVVGLREKEKVKGVLNKVVSPEIAQEITKGKIHLGGETKKVTVLFADIRNFTQISAEMAPEEVVELLNSCMTKISHTVDVFGGVIDKYVGDEVMALFGAPIESEESALKAVQSGLKMIEELTSWNKERIAEGKPAVEMGIGIHTGDVLVGNMGAENRLNYTVIGSNVNLASRLCSAAKGMEVLISQGTLSEPGLKEAIQVEELPPFQLKGFEKQIIVYRVKEKRDV